MASKDVIKKCLKKESALNGLEVTLMRIGVWEESVADIMDDFIFEGAFTHQLKLMEARTGARVYPGDVRRSAYLFQEAGTFGPDIPELSLAEQAMLMQGKIKGETE